MAHSPPPVAAAYRHFYVEGRWRPGHGSGEPTEVVESRSGRVMATVAPADQVDVRAAGRAAKRALPGWSALSIAERSAYLTEIGERLEERIDELAELEALEIGTPVTANRRLHAGAAAGYFRRLGEFAEAVEWQRELAGSRSVLVPYGVAGVIIPWNNPLLLTAIKAGSALVAGCTVVLKASELAPLSAFELARIADDVGLPSGVLNVLSGLGPVAGESLVTDPDVSIVSFTGSVGAARRVAALAGEHIKPVILELGGKSASILLEDATLEEAVRGTLTSSFHHNGQYCLGTTRMIVPRDLLREVEEVSVEVASEWELGDPTDPETVLGPLVAARQRDRAFEYIRSGVQEGASLLAGGDHPGEEFSAGFYVPATVFSRVRNDMRIARDEIFGPVCVIIPYDGDAEEAVRLANDSGYGLGGAVWSADPGHAEEVALRIETGNVEINGGPFDLEAPCGGFKESGFGRESGRAGVEGFLTWQAIHGARRG